MNKVLIFLLLIFPFFIHSDPEVPGVVAATEGDPSAVVAGCVNAVTGDYVLSEEDLVIRGAVPLVLRKTYVSRDGKSDTGWQFFPHFVIEAYPLNKKAITFFAPEPTGGMLRYTTLKKEKDWEELEPIINEHAIGMTNNSSGALSGRTNLKNNRLFYYCDRKSHTMQAYVRTGEGLHRYYKRWRFHNSKKCDQFVLTKEELPNGCWILYEHGGEARPTFVRVVSPDESKTFCWARFSYPASEDDNRNCLIETSDGRVLEYTFEARKTNKKAPLKNRFYLREVTGSLPCTESYTPSSPPSHFHSLLSEVRHGGVLQKQITYHYQDTHNPMSNRVREIFEPGEGSSMIRTYTLEYELSKWEDDSHGFKRPGKTIVKSADGLNQYIHWTKQLRPYEYRFYEQSEFLSWHRLYWGKEKSDKTGLLKARTVLDSYGTPLRTRVFEYDGRSNVIKDTLYGNFSGHGRNHSIDPEGGVKGDESYDRYYTYSCDERNLLFEERESSGKITRYQYLPGTSLLTEITIGDEHKILKRHRYEYDSHHLLVAEITDHGKKRIIRRSDGLPECIEEYTNEGGLLSREVLHYSNDLLVTKKDRFDVSGNFAYSLHFRYDSIGRVIGKTDPLGRWEEFTYDHLGRCVEHLLPSGLKTSYLYNARGLLLTKEETGKNGEKHVETYSYTPCGKRNKTTDYLGNTTTHHLDALGRKKRIDFPNGSSEHFVYDSMGNLIRTTSRSGAVTEMRYNAYGKPIQVHHPDGSSEKYVYNFDGTLKEKIDALDARHRFAYDHLGHVVHAQVFSTSGELLKEQSYKYEGDLLLEETDGEGGMGEYKYDGAGRKIEEVRNGARTIYSYDGLGRIHRSETEEWVQEVFYDLLDRVICQRILTLDGRLMREEKYVYDEQGNKAEVHVGDSVEHYFYDGFNRPIAKIDPTGITTRFTYEEHPGHSRKITLDPLGTQTTETFGCMGEKLSTEVMSFMDQHLLREEFDYDPAGRCITHRAYLPRGTITTEKIYDASGNLLELCEAQRTPEQKITRYEYLPGKLLSAIYKNDGEVLHHEYDALGRMTLCKTKNGEGYCYTYDKLSRITKVEDLATGLISLRNYHLSGEVEEEQFLHGLSLSYARDVRGRPKELFLPNKTGALYEWDAIYLKKVARLDAEKRMLYEHVYHTRDASGRPLISGLPCSLGQETRTYDLAGRPERLSTSFHQELVTGRNPAGHVTKVNHQLPFHEDLIEYDYDPLQQLKKEKSPLFHHQFDFDAHGTLLKRDGQETKTNALYQMQKIGPSEYTYDAAGRLYCDGKRLYTYDAFDRLISVEVAEEYRTEYAYDSWHRRLQKNFFVWKNGQWTLAKTRFFLYDGMIEIGSCDENGNMTDFRLLGSKTQAELGSTLAIEVHNRLLIPLHDLRGNITALVHAKEKKIVEAYRYSAFGQIRYFSGTGEERNNSFLGNHWLYFGKRLDEESGLIYFGRRYYHADLGSWITPDPAGNVDRPNLYSFVRANPMAFFDALGFSSEERAAALEMRRQWQNTSTPFSRGLTSTASVVTKPLGYTIYHGSYFVPVPYVCDGLANFGGFLSQNPDHHAQHSKMLYFYGPDPHPRLAMRYLNGIWSFPRDNLKVCDFLSQKLGGQSVHGCYNSTHGIIDLSIDCVRELFIKCSNHITDIVYKDMVRTYDTMMKKYPDGDFAMGYVAHSEGNLIMNIGLDRIQQDRPEILSNLHILGIGSPLIYGSDIKTDINLAISKWDGVGHCDIFGRMQKYHHVSIVEPKGGGWPIFDHSALGATYRYEMANFSELLLSKWGNRP